jgi:hypothetical protein
MTIVVERVRSGRSFNARNRAEIFIDGAQVTVRHVVVDGPRHYLETRAIERGRQAISIGGAGAGGMEVIHVNASPNDLLKLLSVW